MPQLKSLCLLLTFVCVLPLTGQVANYTLTAAAGTVTVAPGVTIPALMFNGQVPGPTLDVTQGQTLRVRFINQLASPSSLHFHGINMPSGMDGVPGITRPAVAPGQEFIYEFVVPDSGTFWYHPHVEEQMTSGLYGMVRSAPSNPASDPVFDVDVPVILHDDTTQAGGFLGGMMGGSAVGLAGHFMNGATSAGQTPIVVTQGQRVRFRFLNAAARTHYVVALDGHSMDVTHTDGHRITTLTKQAIPIGAGERYDAIVTMNNPGKWSLAASNITNRLTTLVRGVVAYSGSNAAIPSASLVPTNLSSGALLAYSQLSAFAPTTAITTTPTRTYGVTVASSMGMGGGMGGGMSFTINGQAWPNVTPFVLALNDSVQLNFVNGPTGMTGGFYHPMHIHGHAWRLMGPAGGTVLPPMKDTMIVYPVGQVGSSASVQFLADNPGEWMFHCHDAEHQMMGMMNTFRYLGDFDADGLANDVDWDPKSTTPALTIPAVASAFVGGGSGNILVQAATGTIADLYIGLPTNSPMIIPSLGTIHLDLGSNIIAGGSSIVGPNLNASFPYVVPSIPSLIGVRFALQAIAWPTGPNGPILSTWHPMTIH